MTEAEIYDKSVELMSAALTFSHAQGAEGRPKPVRADAERLVWQLVALVMDEVGRGNRA